MADVGTVIDRSAGDGLARIAVIPPSCGRCETEGGHCDHQPREMLVRVPPDLRDQLENGYRVLIRVPPMAVLRGLMRVLFGPAAVGGLTSFLAGQAGAGEGRFFLGVATALGVVGLGVLRGGTTRDLPIVSDLLDGGVPQLQPVSVISVGARGGIHKDVATPAAKS